MTIQPIDPTGGPSGTPPVTPDPVDPAAETPVVAVPELTSFYAPTPSEPSPDNSTTSPQEIETPVVLTSDLPPLPVQDEPLPTVPSFTATEATDSTAQAETIPLPEPAPLAAEPVPEEPLPELPAAADAGMPDIDQMELEDVDAKTETDEKEPPSLTNIGKSVAIVGVLLIAGLLLKLNSGTLGAQKIKSKGYTYNFKFYRHSKAFTYGDGSTALRHEIDQTTGSIKLTPTADLLICTQVGNGWKEVFKVKMNKTQVPVCTPDNKTYMAVFPGPDHRQLFTVSYSTVQKSDTYPELKAIFSSVSVKK